MAKASQLVPWILAADAGSLPPCATASVISHAQLTSTGVAVFVLGHPSQPPCVVIKLPTRRRAASGLERERRALVELHADERLGDWRALIPSTGSFGTARGQPYRVDSALPGQVMVDRASDDALRPRLLATAAAAIHVLHRATAIPVKADDRLARRWVDAEMRDLALHGPGRRRLQAQLGRLRQELHDALIGRSLSVSRIHGDYWLGNLLFARSGKRVAGIVDWDAAGPCELPLIDVLHLLLYTRRLVSGQELGEIVCEQLRRGTWSRDEQELLGTYGAWCHDGSLPDRHAVLLYWLRHVAHHTRQEAHLRGFGFQLWERRNVRRVLAAL